MEWSMLITKERLSGRREDETGLFRTAFHQDMDRIVFSSAFRRLQGKTQVHPFPETDYIHTRLTHSIETASVGRSLGYYVGGLIQSELPEGIGPEDLGTIVSAACLIHDIGNPPFGHSGEDAIREWFVRYFAIADCRQGFDEAEIRDFLQFEGNAQGFRTVTRLQGLSPQYGLDLTLSTLASALKYPRLSGVQETYTAGRVSGDKFNIFQAEASHFQTLVDKLGLKRYEGANQPYTVRHPLAFLVEAADDICYTIIDIEDAYKLRLIPFEEAAQLLINLLNGENINDAEYESLSADHRIVYLRAKAIGNMVKQVAEAFKAHQEAILLGTFEQGLITQIPQHAPFREIKALAERKIFQVREKLELEMAGFKIIAGLLDNFIEAALEFNAKRDWRLVSRSNQKLLNLMNFPPEAAMESKYALFLRVTDYVSGMTDEYARDLYRKLEGIAV